MPNAYLRLSSLIRLAEMSEDYRFEPPGFGIELSGARCIRFRSVRRFGFQKNELLTSRCRQQPPRREIDRFMNLNIMVAVDVAVAAAV